MTLLHRFTPFLLALALAAPHALAGEEEAWREVPYLLTGGTEATGKDLPIHRVRKKDAAELRVFFESVELQPGEALEVYDGRYNLVGRLTQPARDVWGPVVTGDTVWLRLRHAGPGPEGRFSVAALAWRKRAGGGAGSESPGHHVPELAAVKLFRVHASGDHDPLPPGSRLRIAPAGTEPDSFTFAVIGYDQKGLVLSERDFRPAVRYSGSPSLARLVPVAPRVWRIEAGPNRKDGLEVTIAVPEKPAFSTRLVFDIADDERELHSLSRIRVLRRAPDGSLEPLAPGSAIRLAPRGQGQDSADLVVVGLDRKGRVLSPAVLAGLGFRVLPHGAAWVETKSRGEYRLHAGPRPLDAGSLTLHLAPHEELRLVLHIVGDATAWIPAGPPAARGPDQPFETVAVTRIEIEARFRGRPRYVLAGPAPARVHRVTLFLVSGASRVVSAGVVEFREPWSLEVAAASGETVVAVEVAWQGPPRGSLRLVAARAPEDGPPLGTRPPGPAVWKEVGTVYGRVAGEGGAGAAQWDLPPELGAASHLRFSPSAPLVLDAVVLVFAEGGSATLPGESRDLAAGQSAAFEVPPGRTLSRVILRYRSAAPSPAIALGVGSR